MENNKKNHKDRSRSLVARNLGNAEVNRAKTLDKRNIRQNADEAEKKLAAMEKAHEFQLRTLRKASRKA